MTPTIRCVDPGRDASAMAAIYAPHVAHSAVSFELSPPDARTMRERATDHLARGQLWLVALDDNAACLGYAYAGTFRQRAAYDATLETSAYVDAAARGLGIGRALYRALFCQLAAREVRQAIAVVTLPNPESATFHERLGFRQAGVLTGVGWKFDRAWDIGLYQRAISPLDRYPEPTDDRPGS